MTGCNRRRLLAATGGTLATGLAGCLQDGEGQPSTATETDDPDAGSATSTEEGGTPAPEARSLQDAASCDPDGGDGVRVANMVPDADSVTIEVGGRTLDEVPYTGVCDRVTAGGSPAVTVTAGGRTLFDESVSIPGDDPRTLAITGEVAEAGTPVTPVAFEEYQGVLLGNGSMFQVVHAAPDAPRLTASSGGPVNQRVADGIEFGEHALPLDDRDIVQTTGGLTLFKVQSGDPIARFSGSFPSARVVTLFITGYQTPEDDSGTAKLAVVSAINSG